MTTDWEAILHAPGEPDLPRIVVDRAFHLRAATAPALEVLGWTYEDSYGVNAADRVHPDDLGRALDSFGQAASFDGYRPPAAFRLMSSSGVYLAFDVSARTIPDLDAVLLTLQPVEARTGIEDLALENVAILETLSDGSQPHVPVELVVQLGERHVPGSTWCAIAEECADPDAPILVGSSDFPDVVLDHLASASAESDGLFGEAYRRGVTAVGPIADALPPDTPDDVIRSLGGYRSVAATPATDVRGKIVGMTVALRPTDAIPTHGEYSIHTLASRLVGLIIDWSHQRHVLIEAANQDPLTDLRNRRSLMAAIDESGADRCAVSVAVLDLDRFSEINNTHGHEAGDRILREIAGRIPGALPEGTRVFRTGGDEFTVLFASEFNADLLRRVGARLLATLRQPVATRDATIAVTGSLGISATPDDTLEASLMRADQAMYCAKREGGDSVTVDVGPQG
ncbi:MAG: sensor domain-containing diguanylate cyclase [Actinomycetota bacterium]